MAKLSDEQRRALRLLTRSPNGCIGAILLAQGRRPGHYRELQARAVGAVPPRLPAQGPQACNRWQNRLPARNWRLISLRGKDRLRNQ
jgi:hypothetical protein